MPPSERSGGFVPVDSQLRRRVPNASFDDGDDDDQPESRAMRRKPGGLTSMLRGPIVLLVCLTVLLLLPLGNSAPTPLERRPPIRSVQLFRKPDLSTGQLIPVEEGMSVIRSQTQPFSIIAAVGPTRTGKSSILGRAFWRGEHENLFETGNGIQSHTGGVWIASEPVVLTPPNGGPPVRVLLIDTEGFSGVGSVTSRTYEANLFGMVYLMSSAVIFNSMFPVDASIVERMNSYGRRTLDVIAELNDYDVALKRLTPKLVWSVQSFNLHNLYNSNMSAADLLGDLKNTSRRDPHAAAATGSYSPGSTIKSTAATAVLGGQSAAAASTFVLDTLFRSTELIPVRRPSTDDEVVANLGRYSSSVLSPAYLQDVARVRDATLDGILPAHHCRNQSRASIPLFPKRCGIETYTGAELVTALANWLKYGHVIDPSETDEALNATAALIEFEAEHDAWFQRECVKLVNLLRSRMQNGFDLLGSSANASAVHAKSEEALKQVLGFAKFLPRKAMARGVELSVFWHLPGKVATYIETATKQQVTQCTEELFQVKRNVEAMRNVAARAAMPTVQAPAGVPGEAMKMVRKSDAVTFEKATPQRLAKLRAHATRIQGDDVKLQQRIGKAHEECFVVFD